MMVSNVIKQTDREINDVLIKQLDHARTNEEIAWNFLQRYFIALGNRVVK